MFDKSQILDETLIPLAKAMDYLFCSRSTIERDVRAGLGFVWIGGRRFTSVEECRRFICNRQKPKYQGSTITDKPQPEGTLSNSEVQNCLVRLGLKDKN